MSGDNAPLEVLRGATLALKENSELDITLVGDRATLSRVADCNGISLSPFSFIPAHDTVKMEDSPMCVIREKTDSSLVVGLKALANGQGDAFVSAGNTGALLVGASLIVRRIRGISRPGIATVLPLTTPMLLLDSGANLVVEPENMEDFAIMGSVYMKKLYNITSPRVGQINNGAEYNKGLALQVETYKRLSECRYINFIGNVEGKDIPFSACDVLVADGFTGNVVLKLTEGMGKFMMKNMKDLLTSNPAASLSAAFFMRSQIKNLKKTYSASEHGGALVLGVRKPVIKAHGGSDANAFKNAIRQAARFADNQVNEEITRTITKLREKKQAEAAKAEISDKKADGCAAENDVNQ